MTDNSRRRLLAMCVATTLLWFGPDARADEVARGVVVRIEAEQVFFDVGQAAGARTGRQVRFLRPITLHHPVSRVVVADELPLGELVIGAAGQVLSMAQAGAKLANRLRIGDTVEVRIPSKTVQAPVRPRTSAAAIVPKETAAVLEMFARGSGRRISQRIAAWEAFLQGHPDSPFASSIREDIADLRKLRKQLLHDENRGPTVPPTIDGLIHNQPTRALHGHTFDLAFMAEKPQDVVRAWLHFRERNSPTYRRVELVRDSTPYFRARLPETAVQAPGLDYFVEIAMQNGDVGSAIGSPDTPITVDIERPASNKIFGDNKNRSRVTVNSSVIDYATFDKRVEQVDRFWHFEIDFLYRLRTLLYGVRVGFGSYVGTVDDAIRDEEAVGFNFGYTEFEFRTSSTIAFAVRLLAGHAKSGLGYGAEVKLRIGAEDKTNLVFELANVAEIGFLSGIRMELRATEAMFFGFGIAVSDQPNQGDLGVQLSTDIGLAVSSWFQPVLRVTLQGRSVEHSGIGVGLGANFDW